MSNHWHFYGLFSRLFRLTTNNTLLALCEENPIRNGVFSSQSDSDAGKNVSGPRWRHQMEPFSVLLAICAGNSPVPGEFLAQRQVTWSFDVFFDLRLIKRLSKQSWGWWFETLLRPLWRHCNGHVIMTWLYITSTEENQRTSGGFIKTLRTKQVVFTSNC